MATENQDDQLSFICYNCHRENFYTPSDYIDKKKGKELLMEMLTYKTKKVLIPCSNEKCRNQNSVTITYI
jgi:hypothetical protein